MLLGADKVKEYSGSELRVYLKERVLRQKDYPQVVIFRPGAMSGNRHAKEPRGVEKIGM